MLGFQIFKKSLSQIFYNLGDALKLTGLIYLVMTILNAFILYGMLGVLSFEEIQARPDAQEIALSGQYWLAIIVLSVLNLLFSGWVAVLWHRFMLLAETPTSMIPVFQTEYIYGYIIKSLKLALILFGIMIPVIIIVMVSGVFGALVSLFMMVIAGIAVVFVSLRISLILPAQAIGKDMLVSQSWNATGSASLAVFIAALLLIVFSMGLQSIFLYLITNNILRIIVSMCAGWLFLMLGVSILTTLYGNLIEGRPLD